MSIFKKVLGCAMIVGGLFLGYTAIAAVASAHVAPPIGKSVCTNSAVWGATGSATVADAGKDLVKETITTTAGAITQTPLATVQSPDGTLYSYTVSGIPIATTSVTVTSTLTWGENSTYVKTVVLTEPEGGCVVPPQTCATSTFTGTSTPDALNGWTNDPSSDTNPTYITDSSAVDGKGELQLTIPAGDNSKTKVTWQHAVTTPVPLAGISGLGYKDNTPVGTDFRPAYQLVVNPHTTLTFATLNWEPGNGNPPDGATAGWVTNANIENGLWWTTKITSGPGSQSSPAKLSVIDALWPAATVTGYGVNIGHLGGNNTAAEINKVDDIQFLCGVTNFEPKTAVVVVTSSPAPPTTPTTAPPTVITVPLQGLPNTGLPINPLWLLVVAGAFLVVGVPLSMLKKLRRGAHG